MQNHFCPCRLLFCQHLSSQESGPCNAKGTILRGACDITGLNEGYGFGWPAHSHIKAQLTPSSFRFDGYYCCCRVKIDKTNRIDGRSNLASGYHSQYSYCPAVAFGSTQYIVSYRPVEAENTPVKSVCGLKTGHILRTWLKMVSMIGRATGERASGEGWAGEKRALAEHRMRCCAENAFVQILMFSFGLVLAIRRQHGGGRAAMAPAWSGLA